MAATEPASPVWQTLTTVAAVVGTIAGSWLTHYYGQRNAERTLNAEREKQDAERQIKERDELREIYFSCLHCLENAHARPKDFHPPHNGHSETMKWLSRLMVLIPPDQEVLRLEMQTHIKSFASSPDNAWALHERVTSIAGADPRIHAIDTPNTGQSNNKPDQSERR